MTWLSDPKLWVFMIGVIAQAAITWYRVSELVRRVEDHENEIQELREWRAAARVELRDLRGGR